MTTRKLDAQDQRIHPVSQNEHLGVAESAHLHNIPDGMESNQAELFPPPPWVIAGYIAASLKKPRKAKGSEDTDTHEAFEDQASGSGEPPVNPGDTPLADEMPLQASASGQQGISQDSTAASDPPPPPRDTNDPNEGTSTDAFNISDYNLLVTDYQPASLEELALMRGARLLQVEHDDISKEIALLKVTLSEHIKSLANETTKRTQIKEDLENDWIGCWAFLTQKQARDTYKAKRKIHKCNIEKCNDTIAEINLTIKEHNDLLMIAKRKLAAIEKRQKNLDRRLQRQRRSDITGTPPSLCQRFISLFRKKFSTEGEELTHLSTLAFEKVLQLNFDILTLDGDEKVALEGYRLGLKERDLAVFKLKQSFNKSMTASQRNELSEQISLNLRQMKRFLFEIDYLVEKSDHIEEQKIQNSVSHALSLDSSNIAGITDLDARFLKLAKKGLKPLNDMLQKLHTEKNQIRKYIRDKINDAEAQSELSALIKLFDEKQKAIARDTPKVQALLKDAEWHAGKAELMNEIKTLKQQLAPRIAAFLTIKPDEFYVVPLFSYNSYEDTRTRFLSLDRLVEELSAELVGHEAQAMLLNENEDLPKDLDKSINYCVNGIINSVRRAERLLDLNEQNIEEAKRLAARNEATLQKLTDLNSNKENLSKDDQVKLETMTAEAMQYKGVIDTMLATREQFDREMANKISQQAAEEEIESLRKQALQISMNIVDSRTKWQQVLNRVDKFHPTLEAR